MTDAPRDLRTFWEDRYGAMTQPTSGKPSAVLERFATGRVPGRALDIGCARGDDALWLAARGWQVTGVDVSQTALDIAAARADQAGQSDRIRFERHTLPDTFPEGEFDLVSALFFQSPVDFDRARVLERAALSIAPGGLLIIAAHNTAPSWRNHDGKPHPDFPSARDDHAAVLKSGHDWREIKVGIVGRTVTGPEGQTEEVKDSHVILERFA